MNALVLRTSRDLNKLRKLSSAIKVRDAAAASSIIILSMDNKATILLFAVVQLLGAKVIAVAPGDIQSQCTSTTLPTDPGHGLVGAYTNTQKPLMDSYWYNRLTGSTGVWDFIQGNVDGNGVSSTCDILQGNE